MFILKRIFHLALIFTVTALLNTASAEEKKGLLENVEQHIKKFAPVFDFDKDCCYPAPAIYAPPNAGQKNPGLSTGGGETEGGRNMQQFRNSNTYVRSHSVKIGNNTYEFILYALYFEKDQMLWKYVPSIWGAEHGHRNDWEWAAVWLKNGKITHASYSAHGKDGDTKPISQLEMEDDDHVKIVYHKDRETTRCMRFATRNEKPENELNEWHTPKLVQWSKLSATQRRLIGDEHWGSAHPPLSNYNFFVQLYNYLPQNKGHGKENYPEMEEWFKAVDTLLEGDTLNAEYLPGGKTLEIKDQFPDCRLSRLYSKNGKYYLLMQVDDNVCIYRTSDNKFVWNTGQLKNAKGGGYFKIKAGGDLYLLGKNDRRRLATGISKVVLSDDGQLRAYRKSNGSWFDLTSVVEASKRTNNTYTAKAPQGPQGVTLYDGDQKLFFTSSIPRLSKKDRKPLMGYVPFGIGNWNDEAGMIRVSPGYEATIYGDTKYEGKKAVIKGNGEKLNLSRYRLRGDVSSVRVRKTN